MAGDNLVAIQFDQSVDHAEDVATGGETVRDGPQRVALHRGDRAGHLDSPDGSRVLGNSTASKEPATHDEADDRGENRATAGIDTSRATTGGHRHGPGAGPIGRPRCAMGDGLMVECDGHERVLSGWMGSSWGWVTFGTVTNGCSLNVPNGCSYVKGQSEQVFDSGGEHAYAGPMAEALTARQRAILEFIDTSMRDRGYPPSVREIGEAVGLNSPATVHNHLATLQKLGYLRRDPTKPRALEVRFDSSIGVAMERRPARHVPLVGDVAAGTDVLANENVEELIPLPVDFTGEGELFMLRVRGDSMIDAGIFDGDFVVVRQDPTPKNGDIVVAGIPGDEATVKTFKKTGSNITLVPANPRLSPMVFPAADVSIFGKVVTVLRRL